MWPNQFNNKQASRKQAKKKIRFFEDNLPHHGLIIARLVSKVKGVIIQG
jgi:hypothetical protein